MGWILNGSIYKKIGKWSDSFEIAASFHSSQWHLFCHRERSEAIYSYGIRLPQSHPLFRRNDMIVVYLSEDFVEWYKEQ